MEKGTNETIWGLQAKVKYLEDENKKLKKENEDLKKENKSLNDVLDKIYPVATKALDSQSGTDEITK